MTQFGCCCCIYKKYPSGIFKWQLSQQLKILTLFEPIHVAHHRFLHDMFPYQQSPRFFYSCIPNCLTSYAHLIQQETTYEFGTFFLLCFYFPFKSIKWFFCESWRNTVLLKPLSYCCWTWQKIWKILPDQVIPTPGIKLQCKNKLLKFFWICTFFFLRFLLTISLSDVEKIACINKITKIR